MRGFGLVPFSRVLSMTYRLSLLLVAVFGVWLTAITGLLAQEQYPLEISVERSGGRL